MKLNRAESIKIKEIAEKHNLSIEEVKSIIKSPYSFIHKTLKGTTFKDNMDREEFDSMKINFNSPSIGKLYASYFIYSEIQKKKNKKN